MTARKLVEDMVEATRQLRKVDVSLEPTDADLDLYNSLREAAHDLGAAANHIVEG